MSNQPGFTPDDEEADRFERQSGWAALGCLAILAPWIIAACLFLRGCVAP